MGHPQIDAITLGACSNLHLFASRLFHEFPAGRDPRRGPGDRRPHFGVSFRPSRPQVALLHHRDAQQRSATSFRRSCAMSKGAAGGGSRRAAAARGTAVQPCTGSRGVGHSPNPTEGECRVVVGQSPRPPLSCTAGAALRCGGWQRRHDQGVPANAALPGLPGLILHCSTHSIPLRGSVWWWWESLRARALRCTGRRCDAAGGWRRRHDQGVPTDAAPPACLSCSCSGPHSQPHSVGVQGGGWAAARLRAALHERQRCDTAGARRRRRDQGVPAMRRCQLCLGCSCSAPLTHTQ